MPRLPDRARQELAALRGLHGRKRLAHIWAYYKAPIVIALILLYIAGYAVYRQATHTPKQQVYLYTDLLLSEREGADQEYVYASEMRITAAVTAQRLDVLLMNAEARDAFAAQGYLADLSQIAPGLAGRWLDVSAAHAIEAAGFPEAVYLGVLANAPHPGRAAAFIDYLLP